MDFTQPSEINAIIHQYMNDQFGMIAIITFFICEAVFAAFSMQARMKQLTSISIGGLLGLLLLQDAASPVDHILQGLMAGGATTIAVAKFKKPSLSSIVEVATPESVVTVTPVMPPTPPAVINSVPPPPLDPIEHL